MAIAGSLHYEIYRRWSQFRLKRIFIPDHEKRIRPNYADLYFLYANVMTRRPKVIFEFGSGYSTLILSRALSDIGVGKLYSMESEHYWFGETKKLIPKNLLGFCEVIESPVEKIGPNKWRYTTIPDLVPDFLYLDGPGGGDGPSHLESNGH